MKLSSKLRTIRNNPRVWVSLGFGLSLALLMGATVYYQFSPGGALSGSWNSQNVNVAAGSPFITGNLPVTNGGTGAATLTTHGVLLGQGTSNVSAVAAMAADTLLQGQGASANPAAVAVNNCGDSSHALSYNTSTHAFGCQSITAGSTTACTHGSGNITGTGFSGTPTFHLFWEKCGDGTNFLVTMHIQGSGTSNAVGFSLTGLTALGVGPANLQEVGIFTALDSSSATSACGYIQNDTITFHTYPGAGTGCSQGWTSTGTKAVSADANPITFSYVMD